jgi:hypothetical protein
MSVPTILYHLTEGQHTDYGWSYKIVMSEVEYERMIKSGWVTHPTLLTDHPEPSASAQDIAEEAVPVAEPVPEVDEPEPELPTVYPKPTAAEPYVPAFEKKTKKGKNVRAKQ